MYVYVFLSYLKPLSLSIQMAAYFGHSVAAVDINNDR